MSFRIFWDDDAKSILHHVYRDTLTVEAYYESIEESAALLATVPHQVDIIVEFESPEPTRRYGMLMTVAARAGYTPPDNEGLTVIVAPRNTLTTLSRETLAKLHGKAQCMLVDNLNHAYQLIQHHRQNAYA